MTNWLTVVAKVFSNTLICLLLKKIVAFAKATHIFSANNINVLVFAIFQDRNFNVTLGNYFVRF